jgi:hypothetical protein
MKTIEDNLKKFKQAHLDAGWTCMGSSDAPAANAPENRWSCDEPLAWPAGTPHSWTVARMRKNGFFRRLWRKIFGNYRVTKAGSSGDSGDRFAGGTE